MLKTLLNNEKIPCITPFFGQGKYVTDFKKKSELFNSFFAKQCSTIQNSSKLLLISNKKPRKIPFQILLSTVIILQQLFVVLILTKLMATT